MRVAEPGIYTMGEADYHADPVAAEPSLSRSIAKLICDASPAHAYAQHPRLGGSVGELASGDDDMDIGSVAHALFLEGRDKAALIPFDSYRSNAAKEARDQAIKAGKLPLKPKQYDAAHRLAEALEAFRRETGLFTEGKPEQTVIWHEGDHWARGRLDWLPDDPAAAPLDLKTTGGLATSSGWGRSCFTQFGADIQAAMYPRGLEFIRGEAPADMLFVVIETSPPYAIRVFGLDPVALEVGRAKAAFARALWVQCLRSGEWPPYPQAVELLLPPAWVIRAWEETRISSAPVAALDPGLIDRMVRAGSFGG